MENWCEQDEILDILKIFGRSEIRIKILIILGYSEAKIGVLSEKLNLTSSNILHAMKALEEIEIIKKSREVYSLTNIGYILFKSFNNSIRIITTLSKNSKFWLSHDISGIPEHLLNQIGKIHSCEIVRSSPENIIWPLTNFIDIVSKAKWMKGISPIFCIEFFNLVKTLLEKNNNVELILTDLVLSKVLITGNEKPGFLEEAYNDGRLKLFKIDDDVKVGFTITDSVISLGLFDREGDYDMANDLVGYEEGALEWGMQLYEYYRNQAVEVRL